MNVNLTFVESPLACQDIQKHFGSIQVLNGITLTLLPGTVLGLIGRNGAGKSTLIRILLGLQQPDSGQSFVLGDRSLAMGDAVKSRLGYVPQQPDALGWMRVGDMLDFVGCLYPRWDREFVQQSLLRWQLPPSSPLSKLSPGERQRVAIIRALAVRPDLLVLDEPAAALDPVSRRDLLREIAVRAAESGTSVLFSTHIVSDLERVASHVAFLHEGKLLLHAPLDELGDTHARLTVPAEAKGTLAARVAGELSRRRRPDGSVSLVIARQSDAPWPLLAADPRIRLDHLGLEDLFIEVAG
ncbi:MAG TPA: ABC transporter ATP-binding protein [Steroidobacteraceae bacterium]|jgi:ABC-2 type transport system ATP-binding protein